MYSETGRLLSDDQIEPKYRSYPDPVAKLNQQGKASEQ